jgi:calcineurin-like phosphoesterase family protein
MRKILFVGDPHATPEALDDCRALMELVEAVSTTETVDEVCILGDLHHTHNVIRAEVMAFWMHYVRGKRLIVGNHDFSGEGSDTHALLAYQDRALVVDRPTLDRGILYLPYFSDRAAFVEACKTGGNTLVCHQTFAGSKYENGFYAEDGVNPDLIPHESIISGHIHTAQTFGRVTYIGAPRWRTRSDANINRALWLYTFDDSGRVADKKSFDTGMVCRQIFCFTDTPDAPFTGDIDPRHDWRIDIRGPSAWVEQRKALFGPGVKVRTFKTDQVAVKVRESEGIEKAFTTYLERFKARHGTPVEALRSLAKERLHV